MRRKLFVALTVLCLSVPAGRAFAGCKLGKMAEIPVTMVGLRPMVTAQINGSDAQFIADSGAFYSMITPASAAEFKLRLTLAPWGLRVTGVGGAADVSIATVKVFTLAGLPIHNIEFLVGGSELGSGSAGVIGQNVFRIGDVEYDLANGAIRLMHAEGCGNTMLAYWDRSEPYSVVNIASTSALMPHTTGTAFINGTQIRVMFDTGAATSVVSLSAAKRAGVKLDAAGVVDGGYSHGVGRELFKTWIAPVLSFKIGEEEIRNTRLRIGDFEIGNADMLIGPDFFLSHRIYVANSQRKLYFTYNGGPVFNLSALPLTKATSDSAPESASQPQEPADEPTDAAGFSRRGTAFAARHDYEHAIAALTRACELEPDEPNYFYQRGMVHWENKQPAQAMEDFDQALKLKPDDVPVLVARADLRLRGRDTAGATADLEAADRLAAKEADIRFILAQDYVRADLLAQAVVQYDLWIAAHADDAKLIEALNGRCWLRAVSGQDLADALADCNAALKLSPKSSPIGARILDNRGLVRLRLGDFDKSIADYDAALKLQPQNAWSLYGRGIDKLRRGKTAEAQSDMVAATALRPAIADEFKKRGITP